MVDDEPNNFNDLHCRSVAAQSKTWITENRQRNNRAVNAAFHGLASWYREW